MSILGVVKGPEVGKLMAKQVSASSSCYYLCALCMYTQSFLKLSVSVCFRVFFLYCRAEVVRHRLTLVVHMRTSQKLRSCVPCTRGQCLPSVIVSKFVGCIPHKARPWHRCVVL